MEDTGRYGRYRLKRRIKQIRRIQADMEDTGRRK